MEIGILILDLDPKVQLTSEAV
eukprot:SAG31_NODE_42173_length_272_cov_2.716763_1_plen_21_part_01